MDYSLTALIVWFRFGGFDETTESADIVEFRYAPARAVIQICGS